MRVEVRLTRYQSREPLDLSPDAQRDLRAFLKSMTDSRLVGSRALWP